MPTAKTQQVDRFYNRVAAGDVPAALAILGDRIEWHEARGMPYWAATPYRGAPEVADRVLGPINVDVEDLTLNVERLVDLGDHVAAFGRYGGTARASRKTIDQAFVHIWTLDREGSPREFRQYTDTARFAAALAS